MLDANVSAQFEVSNNAALTVWNSTMSIIHILDQLHNSYGKPNMMTLFTNDTLFHSPMTPGNSPEMFFTVSNSARKSSELVKCHTRTNK